MATAGFMVVSAIAVVIILKYFITYLKKLRLNYKNFNPGFPLPLIGHSYLFFNVAKQDILERLLSFVRPDPYVRKLVAFIGQNTLVFLYHPDNVEEILSSNELLSKSEEYVYLEPWLGTGLLLSTHEKWHQRRKLLTPAFHFRILNDARDVFNRQSDSIVEVLSEEMKTNNDVTLDIFPYLCRCTLDIILETAMGRKLNIQHDRNSEYAKALQDIVHVLQQRQLIPWYKPDILFNFSPLKKKHDESLKILHSFTKKVIQDKREELENSEPLSKGPIAFLDTLMTVRLPDYSMLSDADIQEEVDTFMFEGHDTTACALTWTLFLLGNNPEIQEKAYAEQVEIFGNDRLSHVTQDHLSKMKYLEACIKEGLRLYPSVPIIGRKLEKDTTIDGLKMKKGSTAIVLVHYLHRNPTIWENPEEFRPERFLDYNRSRHPFAYVPFSAGPRNCIGQKFAMIEEKTVLSKMIRKFKFQSLDKVEDVKPVIEIITRPYEGIRMKIKFRE